MTKKKRTGTRKSTNAFWTRVAGNIKKRNTRLDPKRAELCREIYKVVFAGTESFERERIGADLGYLLGAILIDSRCEWPKRRAIVRVLRASPRTPPDVWNYIKVTDE